MTKSDDSEDIDFDDFEEKESTVPLLGKTNHIKLSIFLFLLFILVSSDVFVDKVLSTFNGLTSGDQPTGSGVVVQGVIMSLSYILINILMEKDLI